MNCFSSTNSCKVTIALICENYIVRVGTLNTCCNSRSSTMSSLYHITIKIIICKN